MAKRAKPGILNAALGCSDAWHSTISIRHETCPSCGGLPDDEEEGLGLVDAAQIAVGLIEIARDDSGDDDD